MHRRVLPIPNGSDQTRCGGSAILKTCLATSVLMLAAGNVQATVVNVTVQQDVSIQQAQPDTNLWQNSHQYLWVGDALTGNEYQSLFGFDVSSVSSLVGAGQSLVINSMSFNAYHNYNTEDGDNYVHLGSNDAWDSNTVTWNSIVGQHGGALDSVYATSLNLNQYLSWDVGSVSASELDDGYLTFFIKDQTSSWNDYENSDWWGNNEAYLTIDYDIVNTVSEPASLMLLGLGMVGLGVRRRLH